MSAERLSMRKLKEILRLKYEAKLKHRQIATSINISPSTVSRYVNDAKKHNITWPLPCDISEQDLEVLIYGSTSTQGHKDYVTPDFVHIYNELQKHKHVTKQLLWEEYSAIHGQRAYGYSQFCHLFRNWLSARKISMRQIHKAGEKMFVDYAGQTVPIYIQDNNIINAQIFIAVLGASNYTFAEATLTQSLPDWTKSHVNAFNYFGGTTEIVVPDNLKSGVSKSCRYDPDLNPTYHQLGCHYNVAIIPARVRSPKDKAKVETGVKIVEQWILARLRNIKFFSLSELNKKIKELLEELNNKPFQKLPDNRRVTFINLDKPALQPLPSNEYKYTEILNARVGIDYHVEVNNHYYSVPYQLVKKKVEVHIENNCISIFHKGNRVAIHAKSLLSGSHTTKTEHMPESHKYFAEWSPEKFIQKAESIGDNVKQIIQHILKERRHAEQCYRSCLGILNLVKDYGAQRLDIACKKAIEINAPRRKHVQLILRNGMDRIDSNNANNAVTTTSHENIRGSDYYQ